MGVRGNLHMQYKSEHTSSLTERLTGWYKPRASFYSKWCLTVNNVHHFRHVTVQGRDNKTAFTKALKPICNKLATTSHEWECVFPNLYTVAQKLMQSMWKRFLKSQPQRPFTGRISILPQQHPQFYNQLLKTAVWLLSNCHGLPQFSCGMPICLQTLCKW